ncbi:hypothetical protein Syun_003685 [Stephania yunnanensis]|uniref:Uncharacterized protein n=1 Tax=Stephania yunnanensis TaxID=152371 RepID=A0AAP0L328_9MAGN
MIEIVASGVYKCDNGLKPGYLNHVKEALKIACPISGIKARPHIDGFGFDLTSNIITAPDDVWEDYLRNYPEGHRRGCTCTKDAFEDVNDVHDSSSTSEPFTAPTEEFDATPTSSRTRTTTADGRGMKQRRRESCGDQKGFSSSVPPLLLAFVVVRFRRKHDRLLLRDSSGDEIGFLLYSSSSPSQASSGDSVKQW